MLIYYLSIRLFEVELLQLYTISWFYCWYFATCCGSQNRWVEQNSRIESTILESSFFAHFLLPETVFQYCRFLDTSSLLHTEYGWFWEYTIKRRENSILNFCQQQTKSCFFSSLLRFVHSTSFWCSNTMRPLMMHSLLLSLMRCFQNSKKYYCRDQAVKTVQSDSPSTEKCQGFVLLSSWHSDDSHDNDNNYRMHHSCCVFMHICNHS